MGRKARNRNADAVLMFWMNLNAGDKLECVIEMMRNLASSGLVEEKLSALPKRPDLDLGLSTKEWREHENQTKGGESQTAPMQVHSVPAG